MVMQILLVLYYLNKRVSYSRMIKDIEEIDALFVYGTFIVANSFYILVLSFLLSFLLNNCYL